MKAYLFGIYAARLSWISLIVLLVLASCSSATLPSEQTATLENPTATVAPAVETQVEPPTPAPTVETNIDFVRDKIQTGAGSWPFVPLNDPEFVAADEADFLLPNELVLGVSRNGESKAYPTQMMWFHHVANDMLGGEPIAVTY